MYGTSTVTVNGQPAWLFFSPAGSVSIADVNGDGLPDLIESVDTSYSTDNWCSSHAGSCPKGAQQRQYVYLNTGTGWVYDPTWQLPADQRALDTGGGCTVNGQPCKLITAPSNTGSGGGTVFMDVNGDGLPDIVEGIQHTYSNDSWCSHPNYCAKGAYQGQYVYLNNGHGWTYDPNWHWPADQAYLALPGINSTTVNGQPASLFFSPAYTVSVADVNGDGLPDLIESMSQSNSNDSWCKTYPSACQNGPQQMQFVYLNTGSGWVYDPTWQPPVDQISMDSHSGSGAFSCAVNGQPCELLTAPSANTSNGGAVFMDVNGDGLSDIVEGTQHAYSSDSWCSHPNYCPNGPYQGQYVYLNNGHGWTYASNWQWPADQAPIAMSGTSTITVNGQPAWITFAPAGTITSTDANGDGVSDLIESIGASYSSDSYCKSYPSSCPKGAQQQQFIYTNTGTPPLLAGITTPTGASFTLNYKTSPQYTLGGTLQNTKPNFPVETLSSITENDNNGNIATTSYAYAGGSYYVNGSFEHKFVGFKTITETRDDRVTTTYYSQGDGNNTSVGEQNDQYALIGKPFRIDVATPSGTVLQRTWYRYAVASTSASSSMVEPSDVIMQSFDVAGTHRDSDVHYTYDAAGNASDKYDYGEVSVADAIASSYSDIGSDLVRTHYDYATSTLATSTLTGFPTYEIIYNQSGTQVSETKHYYDGLPYGQVAKGNETQTARWISGATYATTSNAYTSFGLIGSTTDPLGNVTTTAYDANNLYPATVTNALNQTTAYVYDPRYGQPTQVTDPNNLVTTTTYDALGRPLQVNGPDATGASVKRTTYVYTDTPGSIAVQNTDWITDATGIASYSYKDGLGHVVQSITQAPSNQWQVTDTVYDAHGRAIKQSAPYFAGSFAHTAPTAVTALYTTTSYDALDRPTTISNVLGSTLYTYGTWNTTITNPNGVPTDYTRDARGNLVQVVEHNGSLYTTSYGYDALNNLVSLTDASGNVRNFTYDGLGHRTSAQDLHAPAKAFGTYSYIYDAANNLTQQTDPKNQVINYTYDALNRPLTEDYTGQAGIETTYMYDACALGIGHLCTASSTGAIVSNIYNALGLVQTATTTIGGTPFVMSYAYDRQGNPTTLTYPNGTQVQYAYNSAGLLDNAQAKVSGGSFAPVTTFAYAPTLAPSTLTFGNGVVTANTYDPTQLYRPTSKVTTLPGGSFAQNLSYTYDPVGNITRILNAANATSTILSTSPQTLAGTTTYSYDNLNRLLSAGFTPTATSSNAAPYSQAFDYDALGNLLSRTDGASRSNVPSIIASSTDRAPGLSTSDMFAFNAGATSTNTLLLVAFAGASAPTAATYNGQVLTIHSFTGKNGAEALAYLVNPTPGSHVFNITYANQATAMYRVLVISNINQTTPIDADGSATSSSASITKTLTATGANEVLFAATITALTTNGTLSEGASQTESWQSQPYGTSSMRWAASTKLATSTGAQTMTFTQAAPTGALDEIMVALKVSTPAGQGPTTTTYSYAQTAGANPDAPTQISTMGVSTTTFTYDLNGNTTSAGNWVYGWDYLNRLLSSTQSGAVTNYAYDNTGARVMQSTATSTTCYPSKYYSLTTTKSGTITYATSTAYIYNGDTLLATIDQPMKAGTQTGPPITSYIHPDHLGSTNVVTNASGTVTQLLDYYPYGATHISSHTAPGNVQRQYIGQFSDTQTGLDYLNARYYDSARGQFMSQDPLFLGNPKDQVLSDPQQLNPYNYSANNPISKSDPNGKSAKTFAEGAASPFVYAYNHPLQTTGIVAVTTAAVIAAPVAVAVVGAAVGGYAIGTAAYNAFTAPDADTRDYYLGQGLTFTAFTAAGIRGATVAGTEAPANPSTVGWKLGDDIYKSTSAGNDPTWSTVRARFWKNEAASDSAADEYGPENVQRMQNGLAPQRYNDAKGGMESKELSHEPIPARDGGTNVVPRWPQEHAQVDTFRHPGY